MAESKDKKNSKTQDSFADDLDSMLNLDDAAGLQTELIDDDEAIDRLLMSDEFDEEEPNESELNDIDKLIVDEVEKDANASEDYDEFGDDADYFIPDFQLKPDVDEAISKEEKTLLEEPEFESNVELAESNEDEVGDDVSDDAQIKSNLNAESLAMENDELEQMTEIDEFGEDDTAQVSTDHADFLLADFDISADDHDEHVNKPADSVEPSAETDSDIAEPDSYGEIEDNELVSEINDSPALESEEAKPKISDDERLSEAAFDKSELENLKAQLIKKLAEVNAQVNELKKQQTQLNQHIQQKGNQDELVECRENVDTLRTEQRKVKRNVDALLIQKPVSAYVANAIAILALIVGGGLGFQGYIAKLQLAQLTDFLGKLQEQVNAAPAADAAEKEKLRKQLDEIALANTVTANQVAELSKLIQGDDNSLGGLNKQFEKLNDQDMQMGTVLESLQSKVAALEKGKRSTTTKSTVKKRPVPQENWAVNLVAFKQDWYANRKAEEFVAKGVPAKVNKVLSKGETWYRLVVDGFKSQYEAAAYAARVKKTLNLDSVWVAKNTK